jgi:hypothetical protein
MEIYFRAFLTATKDGGSDHIHAPMALFRILIEQKAGLLPEVVRLLEGRYFVPVGIRTTIPWSPSLKHGQFTEFAFPRSVHNC